MIVVQSPLRVSFFGGGTDFADYYLREGGCVLSAAIDKYIFVTIKERFGSLIRVSYTKQEMVESVDDLQHELIREALKKTGITRGVEVTTMGDIPTEGSGLGSSSTVTVGALQAMYLYQGENPSASQLAREACEIEIDRLRKPIGIQDQYIAAFGGLRFIEFYTDGHVRVQRVDVSEAVARRLNESLLLFFTGVTRKADNVLLEQKHNIKDRLTVLRQMKAMAVNARDALLEGQVEPLGELMHEAWLLKKQLASQVSNPHIDALYDAARQAGAIGGKITGAGGGGFLLLFCPQGKREAVRAALPQLQELPFRIAYDGAKVIFNYRR